MFKEELLTSDEIAVIQDMRKDYDKKDIRSARRIDADIEIYLRSIGYPERLAEYMKDKWYIKLLRKICNRGKRG